MQHNLYTAYDVCELTDNSGNAHGMQVSEDNRSQFQGQGGSLCCMVLVISGEILFREDHHLSAAPREQLLNPSTVLCYRHLAGRSIIAGSAAKGYVIRFDESVVNRAQDSCSFRKASFYQVTDDPVINPIASSEMERFELLAKMLVDQPMANRPISRDIIRCVIDLLLMLFVKNAHTDGVLEKSGNRVREQFYNLLEDGFRTEKKVSGYAKKLFVTANYLNRVMKLETGHTASYHIRKRVTTEALRQAQVMAASAKETAYSLGFNDIAHFSKYFKKETGLTFTSYRRRRHDCQEAA